MSSHRSRYPVEKWVFGALTIRKQILGKRGSFIIVFVLGFLEQQASVNKPVTH